MPDFRDVNPRELRVPPSRRQGADPAKLHRQIALFGRSAVRMPPPWVHEGSDGVLMLYNGVARATRIAKLAPGTLIRVEVIGKLPRRAAGKNLPPVGWTFLSVSAWGRTGMSILRVETRLPLAQRRSPGSPRSETYCHDR